MISGTIWEGSGAVITGKSFEETNFSHTVSSDTGSVWRMIWGVYMGSNDVRLMFTQ